MDAKYWINKAERVRDDDAYTYTSLARDMVTQLGWTKAVDLACALRGHVYGTPGSSDLHADARPIYDRLGWEQSALVAAWFRDARNRPGMPKRRQPGWPSRTSKEIPS